MKINKFWLITITYCLLPVVLALSLSLLVRRLPDVAQPKENTQLWVYFNHPVSQSITPKNNGLNVITVYLKNVSLRNQDPLLFEVSDSTGVIRSLQIKGYNVGDGDNVRFQFNPIKDSAKKPFTFTLTSNSPQETAVGVGFSSNAQSIAYQTFYNPTNRISVFKDAVSYFIQHLLNLRLFMMFLIFGTLCYYSFLLIPSRFTILNSFPSKSSSA